MQASSALATADAALDELRAEAAYAEAQHGGAFGASLMHYHAELSAVLSQAFELQKQAQNLTLNKRMRAALEAHAADIAKHVGEDVAAVRQKFEAVVKRGSVAKPGARGVMESLVGQSMTKAEIWWQGRISLGTPKSTEVAKRDTRIYKRLPGWFGWTAGAAIVAGAAVPIVTRFV